MIWKLPDAKNKFSQVVDLALEKGPQKVTRRDRAVMVVDLKTFERLSGKKKGFKDFLKNSSSLKVLDLKRDHSKPREIEL